jgi:hypothetical protein
MITFWKADAMLEEMLIEFALGPSKVLEDQLKDTENRNPFFGVLTESQIKQMEKRLSSSFK